MPKPSGYVAPELPLHQQVQQWLGARWEGVQTWWSGVLENPAVATFEGLVTGVGEGLRAYAPLWLGLVVLWILLSVLLRRVRTRLREIQKLWLFTLFFLSKRQMMVPLLYTYAKREDLLPPVQLEEILAIREECRHISLKRSPERRLEAESRLSEIIYSFFHALEREGRITEGSEWQKLVEDFEFIDRKLVELQKVYNHEARSWNEQIIESVAGRFFFRLWGFKPFELFALEEEVTMLGDDEDAGSPAIAAETADEVEGEIAKDSFDPNKLDPDPDDH